MARRPRSHCNTSPVYPEKITDALGTARGQAFVRLHEVLALDASQTTRLLWDTYHPQLYLWLEFLVVGGMACVAPAAYTRRAEGQV